MFGVANQLLASVALCVATSAIINAGKQRYAWVTLMPLAFVSVTTLSAAYLNIRDNFMPLTQNPATAFQGYLNTILTVIIMGCAIITLIDSGRRWYSVLVKKRYFLNGQAAYETDEGFVPPEYGCC